MNGLTRYLTHFSFLALACAFLSAPASSAEVGVVGLFPGKAVLVINGGAPRTLLVGASAEGVKLLGVDSDSATVLVNGKRERLSIGQQAFTTGEGAAGGQSTSLSADVRGHFLTTGSVNGATMRFMVDTGATAVALGMSDARRANIQVDKSQMVMVQTANGLAPAWRVTLNSVRVGEVILNGVEGLVHQQDMPMALLGMSFLNRMEMKRDGQTMTLRKRY